MTRSWPAAAALSTLILATTSILTAGCGSAARQPDRTHSSSSPLPALSLGTSVTSAGTVWAAVPMGAPSGPNLFWQLFMLPGPGGRWSLRTPPDIATNGALILAGQAGPTLITGIRPSLDLGFSPITTTRDAGRNWSTLPPDPGLADVPDALAAAAGGQLIALGQDQEVQIGDMPGSGWSTLTSGRALAATAAGRSCALTRLTAAAYTPAGSPLLAGTCGRAGLTGIFSYEGGTWHLAGPPLPAALSGQRVQVIRLIRTAGQDVALLVAGTGPSASLLAAWTGDGGQRWVLSPALGLAGTQPVSASFGPGSAAAVVLSGGRGETVAGPEAGWHQLPALPAGRAVILAMPAAGTTDLLVADGSTLTAWQLTGRPARWTQAQTIKVPIQYGSSSGN